MASEYETKAEAFLTRFGLKFRATFKGDRCPEWCDGACNHGDRYRVTFWRSNRRPRRISFHFWNSVNDMQTGHNPSAYDVLACISGDVYCPDTFDEFCGEYGYDPDSRKGHATFKRVRAFSRRLQAFFSDEEREALAEIQ